MPYFLSIALNSKDCQLEMLFTMKRYAFNVLKMVIVFYLYFVSFFVVIQVKYDSCICISVLSVSIDIYINIIPYIISIVLYIERISYCNLCVT